MGFWKDAEQSTGVAEPSACHSQNVSLIWMGRGWVHTKKREIRLSSRQQALEKEIRA